jgi:hypothetical protein
MKRIRVALLLLVAIVGVSTPTFAKTKCTEVVFDKNGNPHPHKIPCPPDPKEPEPTPTGTPEPTPTGTPAVMSAKSASKCYMTTGAKTKAVKKEIQCPASEKTK